MDGTIISFRLNGSVSCTCIDKRSWDFYYRDSTALVGLELLTVEV